jgi:hypothetical protein
MMPQERRLNPRIPLDHLAYINLPHNNGGIVIDVSEGGLKFHAIGPVRANGPILFRFEVDSGARIDAVGELAWRDETGKSGGLRFIEVPDEIRKQIRIWSSQSAASADGMVHDTQVAETSVEAQGAPRSSADSALVGNTLAANLATEAEAPRGGEVDLAPFGYVAVAEPAINDITIPSLKADWLPAVARRNPVLYSLRPPLYSAPFNEFSMFPLELKHHVAATRASTVESIALSHPVAAVGLTIALAFFISIGVFAYVSTSWAGDLFYDWAEEMWGGPPSQAIPPPPTPPRSSAPDASRLSHK